MLTTIFGPPLLSSMTTIVRRFGSQFPVVSTVVKTNTRRQKQQLLRPSQLSTTTTATTGTTSNTDTSNAGTASSSSAAAAASKPQKVVVLGTGWGGFNLALNLDKNVHLSVVSPRNHFVFTPLLPSCSVGTLECRVIQEPIRSILSENGHYYRGKAKSLDHINKKVICESIDRATFELEYDKLIIAVGVKTNTFGIESISQAEKNRDSVYFLKQLEHARLIRANIIDAFEKASIPNISSAERSRLLTFLVVGGGPTSCEFTAELHDFVKQDVKRLYHDLLPFVKIIIVEAGPALLGPFDRALQEYAHGLFEKRDIDVRLGTAVIGVEDVNVEGYQYSPSKRAILSDGSTLDFGTMVWSAGLAPRTFTQNLDETLFPRHPRNKRLLVDEYLRVKGHEGSIWAMGDAAINETGIPIPQLAQVARQQGIYLANIFNGKIREDEKPFSFFSLGSMAFMGDFKGIYDGSSAGPLRDPNTSNYNRFVPPAIKGFLALLVWRFAYWGRQTSVVNKILIPMHWMKTFVFGRDTSRY